MICCLLFPLLFAAADTGVARPIDPSGPLSRYGEAALQRQSSDQWLGEDKLKHFAFSYLITAGSAGAARNITGHDESVIAGAALGVIAGVGKEILDRKSNGSSSFRDLLWDLAGVSVGVIIMQQAR
jgi:putative lipoprotein